MWWCCTHDDEREQGIDSELVHEARIATQTADHEFWSRGLLSKSALPEMPPLGGPSVHVFRDDGGGTLSGDVYTDVAMKARWWWQLSQRAGWGVASISGSRLLVGLYGPMPGSDQSVPRAELYAVIQALRITGAHPH